MSVAPGRIERSVRPSAAYGRCAATGTASGAGEARTAGPPGPARSALAEVVLEFGRNCSNWAWLEVNRVSPVLGFTVTKYSQFPGAGCSTAWMAAFPGLSMGPGVRPLCL